MRIAFAMIDCNRRDGSARAVNEVAERLAVRGHEVHLFARKAEDLDLGLVQWHRMWGLGWPEVANFATYHWQVDAKINSHSFDIVHSIGCNASVANVITIQNVQPAKKRILDRLGSEEQVSPLRRLTRWLYLRVTSAAEKRIYTYKWGRRPPLFLPVSRGVEAELRGCYDIGPAMVEIIPNAADVTIFKPIIQAQRTKWRADNGIGESDLVLVFCGGEWARKGLDVALRALALLPDQRIKLYVAGDDPDHSRFHQIAGELGLKTRVVFGGFRRDVPVMLAASDIFLFPSRYEAFSLATIEAAACGLPIVASRINGTEDFIKPGETGFFIPDDPAAIVRVLRPLIESQGLRKAMGISARTLVEREYTWDRVTDLTEKAYYGYLDSAFVGSPFR